MAHGCGRVMVHAGDGAGHSHQGQKCLTRQGRRRSSGSYRAPEPHARRPLRYRRSVRACRRERSQGCGDARRSLGAPHRVPVSIKDLVTSKSVRAIRGSKLYEHFGPGEDAPVAVRLSMRDRRSGCRSSGHAWLEHRYSVRWQRSERLPPGPENDTRSLEQSR